jgi:putative FmdB family regulatory protein
MPLYEYQCQACGKKTELLQKMNDAPLAVCPECGGAVKKLFSSPAVQFKGTGWYVTDYKKGGGSGERGAKSGEGGKSEGGGPSESGGKSEGGGETKAGEKSSSSSDSSSASSGSSETKAAKASSE